MPSALVNRVRLNYVRLGDEGEPPREDLVMIHGLATNMAFWYFKYAPEFVKQFRVTLFDLRGHGRSDMPTGGYAPPNLARDLAGLLDHLGIERAHVLAHSFGGVVAMNLACLEPGRVRSLVLADTHIAAVRHVETPREWAYGRAIQPMLDRHGLDLDTHDPYFGYKLLTRVALWQFHGDSVPGDLVDLVSPLVGSTVSRTAAQWLKLMESTSANVELMGDDGLTLDRLRAFRFPILAMYGDNSQARLTGSELLGVWPHAVFRRVRDAGHFFPVSRAEEVISGCRRFWRGELDGTRAQRVGEPRRSYFRSDRVFRADGAWYFTTREKARVGPFAAYEEACEVLHREMRALQA